MEAENKRRVTMMLTARQAHLVAGLIDGVIDAGACEGGLSEEEREACFIVEDALRKASK